MYSLVLATMLTAGGAQAPAWGHGCWGCHGCCGGCYGCCGGCWGCCGGCWGCCGGCWGGSYWGSCYGCSGCYGCYGCCGGCYGCCGGVSVVAVAPAATAAPAATLPPPKKTSYLGNAAAVVVQAPLDVTITVNGQATNRTATEQTFTSPALEPGETYAYLFRAEATRNGRTVTRTQRVSVRAGEESRVDFTDMNSGGSPARVRVKLPADADLYVDGVQVPLTSDVRSFQTPKLEAGRSYYYTLKADVVRDGRTVSATKRITVEPGKETNVEFANLPELAARR